MLNFKFTNSIQNFSSQKYFDYKIELENQLEKLKNNNISIITRIIFLLYLKKNSHSKIPYKIYIETSQPKFCADFFTKFFTLYNNTHTYIEDKYEYRKYKFCCGNLRASACQRILGTPDVCLINYYPRF